MTKKKPIESEMEFIPHVDVISMDAKSAIDFFGFGPGAVAIDAGPPPDPERWKPGARVWHVYKSRAALAADREVTQ